MEYKVAKPSLQDIQTKTLRIVAKSSELGTNTSTVLTIPLASISLVAIAATDVLIARNHTKQTQSVASISGSNLLLTDTAIAASDVYDIVIRLA